MPSFTNSVVQTAFKLNQNIIAAGKTEIRVIPKRCNLQPD